ncbi:MAG: class I SAM-dependent rRNA methyltransferase [Pseudobacteriovorax sp.]|nr:class I SAM-dependent rRNA methyltransferase [Pseudobacteriovorax sp.]
MIQQIKLKPGKERSAHLRHPWIFSGAIKESSKHITDGDLVEVLSHQNRHLATGFYNSRSQIRVRLIDWDQTLSKPRVPKSILRRLIAESIRRRDYIDRNRTNAMRLVAHESDFLPGLVIDQYNDWVVFQILTLGMEKHRELIIDLIRELLEPKGIIERSDESIREKEGLKPFKAIHLGELPKDGVPILENDMKLFVDVWEGHKTGFYLDQRDSRATIRSWSKGKSILNCFSYTGGFSVAAALGGATKLRNIDNSLSALELAEKNHMANGVEDRAEFIQGDVFAYLRFLRDENEKFDMIILDPPKFISSQRHLDRACRGYKDLNLLAWQILKEGGLLASFSCSGLMPAQLFQKVVFGASQDAGCDGQILEHFGQASDHPTRLSFPESYYLKGLLMRKVSYDNS